MKELDKAFASATKALSVLGIKLKMTKPDPSKLEKFMQQTGKKAEFKLTANGDEFTAVVEIGNNGIVCGKFDLQDEKDLAARKEIAEKMVANGAADRSLLNQFKEAKGAPDPKVAANLARELAYVSKEVTALLAKVTPVRKGLQMLRDRRAAWAKVTYKDIKSMRDWWNELKAFAEAEFSPENLEFLEAARGRMKYPELVEMFVKDGAAKQVNLSAPHRAAFVSAVKRAVESKDSQDHSQDLKACESALADAVKEIEDVVEKDTVRRFKPSKEAQYDQQIAQVSQKIAPFEAQLQKLGARLKVLQDQKKKLAA